MYRLCKTSGTVAAHAEAVAAPGVWVEWAVVVEVVAVEEVVAVAIEAVEEEAVVVAG